MAAIVTFHYPLQANLFCFYFLFFLLLYFLIESHIFGRDLEINQPPRIRITFVIYMYYSSYQAHPGRNSIITLLESVHSRTGRCEQAVEREEAAEQELREQQISEAPLDLKYFIVTVRNTVDTIMNDLLQCN